MSSTKTKKGVVKIGSIIQTDKPFIGQSIMMPMFGCLQIFHIKSVEIIDNKRFTPVYKVCVELSKPV